MTTDCKQYLFYARYEAGQSGSEFVEIDHLLVAMIKHKAFGPGVSNKRPIERFLTDGHTHISILKEIQERLPKKPVSLLSDIPFSYGLKHALATAKNHCDTLGREGVYPEDLLYGILRRWEIASSHETPGEESKAACQALAEAGVTLEAVEKYISGLDK